MVTQRFTLLVFKKLIGSLSGCGLTRFYFVRLAFYSLASLFKKFNVIGWVQGHKISLGSEISLKLFISGPQNPFEIEIFRRQIKEGDIVLDLGANIGYYTLIAARSVGKHGKVFSFEPDPNNFAILKKNVEINDYRNITLVQKAVSDKTGKSKLYLCENDASCHTICDPKDDWRFIKIEATRLDDYFKDYDGRIDFIKMDIEGAEGWAIQGMSSTLKKNKNLKLFTEFNPSLFRKSNIKPERYLKLLLRWNFKLYHINERKKELESVVIDELVRKYTGGRFINLLCLKGDIGFKRVTSKKY